MNNSGFKYNDNYIFGIDVGTNISTFVGNVTAYNSKVVVAITDSSNKTKTDNIFKTGDKVIVTGSDGTKTYTVIVSGDINGDGIVSEIDYVKVKNYISRLIDLDSVSLEAADINRDGLINAIDLEKLNNRALGRVKLAK